MLGQRRSQRPPVARQGSSELIETYVQSAVDLGAVLDSLPDAFLVLDGAWTVRYANASAAVLCGARADTLAGRPLMEVLPQSMADPMHRGLAAVAESGEARNFDLRGTQGIDWYAAHASPSAGGFVLHLHDVTTRHNAEHGLGFLADTGAVLAGVLDEARLLPEIAALVVPRLADWCLVAVRDANGGLCTEAAATRDAVAERLLAISDRQAADALGVLGSGMDATEPVLLSKDECARAASAAEPWPSAESMLLVPLPARHGNAGTIVMGRGPGASPFRGDEVEVARTMARRFGLVLENARLYEAAQRATHLRDDVLAIVAHDLRNPLNVIVLGSSALPDDTDPDVPKLQRTAKRSILAAAERMDRLLNDLLNAARLDAGWVVQDPAAVPVAQFLEECADTFRARAEQEGIRLELKLDAADCTDIPADADRLHEALSNLLDNALKFTPRGGTVVLSAERTPNGLLLAVTDSGAGIDPELLPHLFDRFWQARSSGRAGAGLGLFIARRIVEGHHGRIWAESEPGRGSVFRMLLPCCGHPIAPSD